MKTQMISKLVAAALVMALPLGAFSHSAGQQGVAVDIVGGAVTPDGGGLRLAVDTVLSLRFADAAQGDTVKITLRGETDQGNSHGAVNMLWGALESGGTYSSFNASSGPGLYESSWNYNFTDLVGIQKSFTFSGSSHSLMEMKVTGLGSANYFRIDALEVEIAGETTVSTYNCGPIGGGDLSCTSTLY